jgi:histidine triad (HIT) family protein
VVDDGRVERALDRYDGNDFYCDVALPNIAALDVVHDGEGVLAFHHTRPFWPVHIVVVPKRHVPSLTDPEGADDALARELLAVVQDVASAVETTHGAARVLTNLGTYQDSKHLHVHVSSGDPLR